MYENSCEFKSILNISTISSDKDNSYSLRNKEYIYIYIYIYTYMILYSIRFL